MKVRIGKFLSLFVIALLLVVGCSSKTENSASMGKSSNSEQKASEQKIITITMAHESPANSPKGLWADIFKEVVEEKSGGNIKVDVFHQGSLYDKEQAALEAVGQGIIQVSLGSTGYLSAIEPSFEVFDLPMLFSSQESLYKVLDSEVGQELLAMLESKGLKGLGYATNVPIDLFSKSEITSMEQLADKKIRVHTAMLEKAVTALGGNPITMPASEVFMAIQQGVLDGVLTTVAFAAPNKFDEIVSDMTQVQISAVVYPVVMNLDFWNSLTEEQQKIIEEATTIATQANRDDLSQVIEGHIKSLTDGGVNITQLSTDERQRWKDSLQGLFDEFSNKELLDRITQIVN